jgi:hypothetical protein
LDSALDDAELAAAMARLLDPDRRAALAAAARRTALRHTLQRNADEILAVYEELMAMRRLRRTAPPERAGAGNLPSAASSPGATP